MAIRLNIATTSRNSSRKAITTARFHRVIKDFMVQAGDPDSRTAAPGQRLGTGGPDYKIDAEIVYPKHFHKRGRCVRAIR